MLGSTSIKQYILANAVRIKNSHLNCQFTNSIPFSIYENQIATSISSFRRN